MRQPGGCEIKCFGIKFEAGRDAEVVSTIEKTPGTVHRQYVPGFLYGWGKIGFILIRKFRDRPGCGGGSGQKKESGTVHRSTSHSLFSGRSRIRARTAQI